MSYQKFFIDNPICSRRFHLSYDDESKPVAETSVICPHCNIEIFKAEQHPPVDFARDENLTKTTTLSRKLVKECDFKDPFVNQKLKAAKILT